MTELWTGVVSWLLVLAIETRISIWYVSIFGLRICRIPSLEVLHCSEGEIGKVLSSNGLSIRQRAEKAKVPRGGMFPTE